MSKHLKSFALGTLVFSLTCGVGLAANDLLIKHTLAQTATSSDKKVVADKLFQATGTNIKGYGLQSGKPANEALRATQLKMWLSGKWRHPN